MIKCQETLQREDPRGRSEAYTVLRFIALDSEGCIIRGISLLLGCFFGSDVYMVLGLFNDMGLNNQHILHLGGEEGKMSKCLELTPSFLVSH